MFVQCMGVSEVYLRMSLLYLNTSEVGYLVHILVKPYCIKHDLGRKGKGVVLFIPILFVDMYFGVINTLFNC